MVYRSKKDPTVTASLDYEDEKFGTVMMIYLTGENSGKSFSITNSTLKRWWEPKIESPEDVGEFINKTLNIDIERVNTPYAPDVKPRYIKKPEAVERYEAKKREPFKDDLPTFEELLELFKGNIRKINKDYFYILEGSAVWRYGAHIKFTCTPYWIDKMSAAGFTGFANKWDKTRSIYYNITNKEEFDKFMEVISNG